MAEQSVKDDRSKIATLVVNNKIYLYIYLSTCRFIKINMNINNVNTYAYNRKTLFSAPCVDTYSGDCTQFVWACTDSRYTWFKNVCKKTCEICS